MIQYIRRSRWVVCILALVVLSSCANSIWYPSPPPGTPTPLPVTIDTLLIDEDDIPVGWWQRFVQREGEREKWKNLFDAVDAVRGVYSNSRRGTVTQTVVRMDSSARAASLWQLLREDSIESALPRYELMEEQSDIDLPIMHSDQIIHRCEDHGDGAIRCAVRMQYGPIYTEVKGDFTDGRISTTEFHQFLEAVDQRMKPIWSSGEF